MKKTEASIERPPVVAIMGHIDHGKSTLLDYVRKSNIVDKEAGGITQHIAAYEVERKAPDGSLKRITFLDTPGHEAFGSLRVRGAQVADIAILIISAEDGVKPQTLEALECIKKDELPFVVAINKIDKAGANIDKTKQDLAEHDVFVEGYGGNISWVGISAKTGEGVDELLDLVLLTAELESFTGDAHTPGSGVIIESNLDTKKGITATAIIKNGTVSRGDFAVSGISISPLRIVEDFQGKMLSKATFSSPIRIVGWDSLPEVGAPFTVVKTKKEALALVEKAKETGDHENEKVQHKAEEGVLTIPVVIKADTTGSLEAIRYEMKKIEKERITVQIILSAIGPVNESDIKAASINENALVIGFNTKIDPQARSIAERLNIEIHSFDIIYKLTEWLNQTLIDKTPSIEVEESTGRAKILKVFSKTKDKQVVGGRAEVGAMVSGAQVKILRRDGEIGMGRIKGLQMQKVEAQSVPEGNEFGAMIESRIELIPGDHIETFKVVKK